MNAVNKNSGFTLIEILVVIGIIGVIVGISVGVFITLSQEDSLDAESQKLLSNVRLSRNKTVASENDKSHGIKVDKTNGKYWLYEGSSSNTTSEEILDKTVSIKDIGLINGTTSIAFEQITGAPVSTGYVQLQAETNNSETRTVCITEAGSSYLMANNADPQNCNTPALEYTEHSADDDITEFPEDTTGTGDPAQEFTTDGAIEVAKAKLSLKYQDDDSDDTYDEIYAEIRDSINGTVLGKSTSISGSDIPHDSFGWVEFVFPRPVSLSASTTHVLRIRSLPDATHDGGVTNEPTLFWSNNNTSSTDYEGGEAWRRIGTGNPEEMSSRDFVFKIFSGEQAGSTDDRHIEINLEDNLEDYTSMTLDFDGGATTKTITIADFVDSGSFEWEETVSVSDGNDGEERVRIHTTYMDSDDTILHVHRPAKMDEVENDVSLDIDIDSTNLLEYDGDGVVTSGPGTADGYHVAR